MCVYCQVITHGVTEGGTIDKGYHGGKVRIGWELCTLGKSIDILYLSRSESTTVNKYSNKSTDLTSLLK